MRLEENCPPNQVHSLLSCLQIGYTFGSQLHAENLFFQEKSIYLFVYLFRHVCYLSSFLLPQNRAGEWALGIKVPGALARDLGLAPDIHTVVIVTSVSEDPMALFLVLVYKGTQIAHTHICSGNIK